MTKTSLFVWDINDDEKSFYEIDTRAIRRAFASLFTEKKN